MAGKEGVGADIHASIVRLRREAEWYRRRLQETCDRIAVLEQATTVALEVPADAQRKTDDVATAPNDP
jgi:hypothetical protein